MPQAPFRSRQPDAAAEAPDPGDNLSDDDNISDDDDIISGASGSYDEEDDEFGAPAPVLSLSCAACSSPLSSRGVCVYLVADVSASLFSTDIPSDWLREGGPREIPTCECRAVNIHCRGCESRVGYHVVQPCTGCTLADHNGHFWLFDATGVNAVDRGITWDELTYNGAPEEPASEPSPAGADDAAQDEEASVCPVCAASPMWRPHRFRDCGHVFCFGCASRECDMRGRCPLDRRPATRDMLEPCGSVGRSREGHI